MKRSVERAPESSLTTRQRMAKGSNMSSVLVYQRAGPAILSNGIKSSWKLPRSLSLWVQIAQHHNNVFSHEEEVLGKVGGVKLYAVAATAKTCGNTSRCFRFFTFCYLLILFHWSGRILLPQTDQWPCIFYPRTNYRSRNNSFNSNLQSVYIYAA